MNYFILLFSSFFADILSFTFHVQLMCELGNTVINQIYEGACEELGAKKPGPSSSRFVCFFCFFLQSKLSSVTLVIILIQAGERSLDQI